MTVVRPIPRPVGRIVVHFAAVVCPPELLMKRRLSPLLREFTLYLNALPRHLRLGILAAFVLFDLRARFYGPARGRRFVDLDLARADDYFSYLAQRSTSRDRALTQLLKGLITLCYYELPQAQAEIGYQPEPYIAEVARRRQATYGEAIRLSEAAVYVHDAGEGDSGPAVGLSAHQGRPGGIVEQSDVSADLTVTCDVVIVGSGAGGATMAAELADAGMDVVVVEEGGYHPTESFSPQAGQALRTLYRDAGAQSAVGSPPIVFSEGRCVGGSTVINGGMCWRTPDAVLERWSRREASGRYYAGGDGETFRQSRAAHQRRPPGPGVDRARPGASEDRRRPAWLEDYPQSAQPGPLRRLQYMHFRLPDGSQALDAGYLSSEGVVQGSAALRRLPRGAHNAERQACDRNRGPFRQARRTCRTAPYGARGRGGSGMWGYPDTRSAVAVGLPLARRGSSAAT